MDELELVTNVMQNLGMWIIGFVLFFQERKAHELTRNSYFNDLREMAGIKTKLSPNPIHLQAKAE